MAPRIGPRERARDELGVELQRVDLAVGDAGGLRHRARRLVLVHGLALAPGVAEAKRGDELDGRELGATERAPASAARLLAQEPRPLGGLARESRAARVIRDDAALG